MKSRFYRLSLLSIMLGTLSLNAALADDIATHNVSTGNIAVSFADLNLASPTGLANLYQRVQSAADKVCGVDNMRVSLDIERKNRVCVSWAIDNAIGEIDDVRLTALHQTILMENQQS